MRRRQHRLEIIEAEDFFDKGEVAAVRSVSASPGPSITGMTMSARPESYVSRDIHFGVNYAGQGVYGLDQRSRVSFDAAGIIDTKNPSGVGASYTPSQSYLKVPSQNNGQNPFTDDDSFYGYIDTSYGGAL
jgi:hypothetical protein